MADAKSWVCMETGKRFFKKERFLDHLNVLAEGRRYVKENAEVFKRMRDTCDSTRAIQKFIEDNWDNFVANASLQRGGPTSPVQKQPKPASITLSLRWNDAVGNSHSAPFGKPQNFTRKPDLPMSYPGWEGTIEFSLNAPPETFASAYFDNTGIFTGSGGGGNLSFKFRINLFADDWTAMTNRAMLEIMSSQGGSKDLEKSITIW